MTNTLTLDPSHSAVLSMDLQAGIVSIYAGDQKHELLSRASSVLEHARSCGMTVIHVQVGFRPNLPEVSSRNLLLGAIKHSPQHQQLFQGTAGAIHPDVAPTGEDITVVKHRVSAFLGTDLEMILRSKEIDTLIMFGIATSGVVLATLLQASDLDYRIIVVKDCCADLDPTVHSCLIEKVFVRQAEVITADQFIEAIEEMKSTEQNEW